MERAFPPMSFPLLENDSHCAKKAESLFAARAPAAGLTVFPQMEGSAVDYFRLAYRAVASKPLEYFKTSREVFAPPQKDSSLRLGSAEQPFLPGDDTSLAGLLSHREDKTLDEHFWMLLSGAFGVRRLQAAGYFGPERANAKKIGAMTEDESFVGTVLVNIFGVMQYNTHGIIECVSLIRSSC